MIVNVVDNAPDASVDSRVLKGFEHETGTLLPANGIVGWLASLLHSRMAPLALAG